MKNKKEPEYEIVLTDHWDQKEYDLFNRCPYAYMPYPHDIVYNEETGMYDIYDKVLKPQPKSVFVKVLNFFGIGCK